MQAVSMDSNLPTIPIAAAIVVIAVSTLIGRPAPAHVQSGGESWHMNAQWRFSSHIVSFMGYRVVHLYEKYSWYPVLIVFMVYAGFIGSSASAGDWGAVGETAAANVLSFGTLLYLCLSRVRRSADRSPLRSLASSLSTSPSLRFPSLLSLLSLSLFLF